MVSPAPQPDRGAAAMAARARPAQRPRVLLGRPSNSQNFCLFYIYEKMAYRIFGEGQCISMSLAHNPVPNASALTQKHLLHLQNVKNKILLACCVLKA